MNRRVVLKVLVTDPMHQTGIKELSSFTELAVVNRPTRAQFLGQLADTDVLVCRSSVKVDAEAFDVANHLRAVIRAGNGLDNIDVTRAEADGVELSSIPSPGVNAVAEFVIGHLLGLSRHIVEADRQVREGQWNKALLCGTELGGRTLGIVGCGKIGSRVAELAQGFGMHTLASVARQDPARRTELAARGIELCPLEELIERSDAISVQVPGAPETRNLIDAALLERVRQGCMVVDVSRAGVVNHHALLAGLNSGRLAGVAVDVHAEESGIPVLAQHERAVLTPHLGGSTDEAQERIAREVVSRIRRLECEGRVAHGNHA
ncbi:NAD(P)-dependent oxidoreductase [Kocuria sp.]|uniref:NAD(P)-dependent oxidoreductase n=1 Tax=Kocuria sp. TaxID=1871328 RepID=UPI0026E0ED21|nr:NAD(P)-dependent oxidoreductase [Kocuria sp.]MDO5618526.1 NAD(P)-dependent oxidoreductase [Kocuria sp.]